MSLTHSSLTMKFLEIIILTHDLVLWVVFIVSSSLSWVATDIPVNEIIEQNENLKILDIFYSFFL
ncbi:hypothetical protein U3516DRAFT_753669 [Neocallimastix sp. 'constans']